MDVIVNPIRSSRTEWGLNDCLGHRHGMIYQSAEFTAFEIESGWCEDTAVRVGARSQQNVSIGSKP